MKRISKADFTHVILEEESSKQKFIVIEDLVLGNRSVTNDIENVVVDVCNFEDIKIDDYKVIYKDSDGTWNGYIVKTNDFVYLASETPMLAIKEYMKKLK